AVIDPHRDVRRLRVHVADDVARVGGELHLRVGVADLLDGLAGQFLDVADSQRGLGGDLAGDNGQVGGDEGLAGDAAGRVVLEAEVEDRVGDLIGHLVRVAHGDRLTGKQEALAHRTLRKGSTTQQNSTTCPEVLARLFYVGTPGRRPVRFL